VLSGGQTVNTQYGIGAANRLLSFATTANPPGGPTPSASYTYDANGNEIGGSRTWAYNPRNQATTAPATSASGTLAQTFLGEGQAERVSEGAATFRYNRLGLSSRNDASGTTYVTRDNNGRVVSERSGVGTRRYYAFDGLGSTVSLTDASGNETSSYSYDPFGNRVAGAGGAEAMFQFAGGYRMPNGLYHFGQRYYDPVVGRFTQQDPLDQVADLRQGNRYLYAGSDPVNLVDPTGLLFEDIQGAFRKGGKWVVRKAIAANGLVCFVRKSVAKGDKNTLKDDVAEAVNCVNPISGTTGDVGGSDGK